MRIGVPKEIKNHEYRVGLAPSSVRELVAHGHEVMVQEGAGAGIGSMLASSAREGSWKTIHRCSQERRGSRILWSCGRLQRTVSL